MSSVVKAFDKWLRNNWPTATAAQRLLVHRAWLNGREHGVQERKVKQGLTSPK